MAEKLPRRYFCNKYVASITVKKVRKADEHYARTGIQPYFGTWEQAHAYLSDWAAERLARAKKELASSKRFIAKVAGMQPRTPPAPEAAEAGEA